MTYLVTDTHPLVWYVNDDTARKLPRKVKKAFDGAVEGRIAIWVPIVVLWELSLLEKAGKIRITMPLEEFVAGNFFAKAMHLLDLVPQDVLRAHELNFSRDPFDVMIVAMAQRMSCPLI